MGARMTTLLGIGLAFLLGLAGLAAAIEGEAGFGALLAAVGAAGAGFLLRRDGARPAAPLPEAWRRLLDRRVAYYRRLDPERRQAFERGVAEFIARHRFTGVGTEPTDELKVLAAASALMLVFNRPDLEYPRIPEIVFLPGNFDGDFRHSRDAEAYSGMNADFGAVVFSAPDLRESFEDDDAHVGLHEFAHALDRSLEEHHGIPVGMGSDLARRLDRIRSAEMRLAREERSVLDPYGATDEVEFFAVATEAYFQRTADLRDGHAELHAILEGYYGPVPPSPEPGVPRRGRRRPRGHKGRRPSSNDRSPEGPT